MRQSIGVSGSALRAILCVAMSIGVVAEVHSQTPIPERIEFLFERFRSGPGVQTYRIEIGSDGWGRYHGLHQVRLAEQVGFRVSRKRLQAMVDELRAIGFFEFQPKMWLAKTNAGFSTVVALYVNERTHAIVYDHAANSAFDMSLQKVLEKYAPTWEYRCPYVIPPRSVHSGIEVCGPK